MEIDIELPGVALAGWLPDLRAALAVQPGLGEVQVDAVRRAGAFGADTTPTVRVKTSALGAAAAVAAIVGAVVALYGATLPTSAPQCRIILRSGQVETMLEYDCRVGVQRELTEVLERHVRQNGAPQSVRLAPAGGAP